MSRCIDIVELRDILNEAIEQFGNIAVCVPRDEDYAALGEITLHEFCDPDTGENIMYFLKLTPMEEQR